MSGDTPHPDLIPNGDPLRRATDSDDGTDYTFSTPRVSTTQTTQRPSGPLPTRIGHYHIRRMIASGGMGTVYEATQERPRRTVALKLMRHGIASRSALKRFEYESQILARLQHPGIAQIYEAGTHDDGGGAVPYFAMEYIPNAKSITDYAKEKKLGARERLELFTLVCDAVHHGHLKGIIHRDLKPGNILVDSNGDAKIIDFGVARGTDSDLAITTLQTDLGELVGTLQYMSPEQCRADPHDIDTRSDIYALGVVLYQLLAEQLPYDVSQTPALGLRMIQEERPPRLRAWDSRLKGDVETIVLKALEKDRARRYQSALGLAEDIRRYLVGEAIVARAPSIIYLLRVFARRHKGTFWAIAAVFVVLTAGVLTSTALYVQARSAREQATREADKAMAINEFLVNDMLTSADPAIARGRKTTAEQMLANAAERIDSAFSNEPELAATIRITVAKSYMSLGVLDTAEEHLQAAVAIREREFGAQHPETLRARSWLAGLLRLRGKYAAAETLARQTLTTQRQRLGYQHPEVLHTMDELAMVLWHRGHRSEAEAMHRETLRLRNEVLGAAHRDTLTSTYNLAVVLGAQGNLEEAESLHHRALTGRRQLLGNEHPNTLKSMGTLGLLFWRQGRLAEAETALRQTLTMHRRILGQDHPSTLKSIHNLAVVLQVQGEHPEAEALYREALASKKRVLREGHPSTLTTTFDLIDVLALQGKTEEARPFVTELVAHSRRVAEQPDTDFVTLNAYAWLLLTCEPVDLRDPKAALVLARSAVEAGGARGPGFLNTLALAYQMTGDFERAFEVRQRMLAGDLAEVEGLYRASLARRRENPSKEDTVIGETLACLGEALLRQRKFSEAEPVLRECLVTRETVLADDDWRIGEALVLLAEALAGQRRFQEAEGPMLQGYHILTADLKALKKRVQYARRCIVRLYEAWQRPEKAASYRQAE